MTPIELLNNVKARFDTLLVDDDEQLTVFLRESMRVFQNKAGIRERAIFSDAGIHDLPSNFLAISSIKDSDHDAIFTMPMRQGDKRVLSLPVDAFYPVTLSYFINFSALNLDDEHLPDESIELISKYLQVLIERENDVRVRRIESLADADVSDLSTPADKAAELIAIEEQMTKEYAFVEMVSVQ